MYGKWVTVNLGDSIKCRVWVNCVPSTPENELQQSALRILKNRLPEKKEGTHGLGDSLQAISDYEYSQGFGIRFEMEKKLEKMINEL
jgi:hypothetical protein